MPSSSAGEGCALSLTLYLPWGQVAIPGGLAGTEAAFDPRAQVGPLDLDRHVVDEWWRYPLVFIHPMGQDREGGQLATPVCPEDQGGRTHSPVQLVVKVIVTAAVAETNGGVTVQGLSPCPEHRLTWGNRNAAFP